MKQPLFDPAPLVRAARSAIGDAAAGAQLIGDRLGVPKRMVQRWLHDGHTLSLDLADIYAGRLGLHPMDLWPDWYEVTAVPDGMFDDDESLERHVPMAERSADDKERRKVKQARTVANKKLVLEMFPAAS